MTLYSESLKTQVESNIKFAEDATECLHHHRDAQQDDGSSFTLTLDPSTAIEAGNAARGAGGELVVRGAAQHGITKRHDSTIFQSGDFDGDDCALQASQNCTQIVEMQQMSCALARDVLDHQSLKPTWSWNATERSSAHEGLQFFPASEGGYPTFRANTSSYSTADQEASANTPAEEKAEGSVHYHERKEHRIPLGELLAQMNKSSSSTVDTGVHRQRSSERDDEEAVRDSSSRQHVSRDEKDRIDRLENLLIEKEKAEKEAAEKARAKTESSKFDRLENLLISQQEAKIEKEKAKKEAAEQVEKARKAPIVFYDAIDRKFECPWRLCSNWGVSNLPACFDYPD